MIHYVDSCSCKPGQRTATDTIPEYYQDEEEARQRFVLYSERDMGDPQNRYWGIHFKGRHIIAVD